MKTQKGIYAEFPGGGCEVEALRKSGRAFKMHAKALYFTWNSAQGRVFIHFAGDKAGESYSKLEMPLDADYLRQTADQLIDLAKRLEDGSL